MTRESATTCIQLPDEIMPLSFNHLLPIGGVCVCGGGGGGGGGGYLIGEWTGEDQNWMLVFIGPKTERGEIVKVLHVKGRNLRGGLCVCVCVGGGGGGGLENQEGGSRGRACMTEEMQGWGQGSYAVCIDLI